MMHLVEMTISTLSDACQTTSSGQSASKPPLLLIETNANQVRSPAWIALGLEHGKATVDEDGSKESDALSVGCRALDKDRVSIQMPIDMLARQTNAVGSHSVCLVDRIWFSKRKLLTDGKQVFRSA
jgi:hypothetical protein